MAPGSGLSKPISMLLQLLSSGLRGGVLARVRFRQSTQASARAAMRMAGTVMPIATRKQCCRVGDGIGGEVLGISVSSGVPVGLAGVVMVGRSSIGMSEFCHRIQMPMAVTSALGLGLSVLVAGRSSEVAVMGDRMALVHNVA